MSANDSALDTCAVCDAPVYTLEDPMLRLGGSAVRYDVCTRCGFTRKPSRFHPDPVSEKQQYDQHENTPDNEGYVAMLDGFLRRAVDPFVVSGRALDFGSGPGPILKDLLKGRGFKTDHYDPIYHPDRAVFKKRYDVITATEVFEHFHHPLEETLRLCTLLEDGGILAVMTSLRMEEDETFLDWWYRRDPTHVSFYTARSFDILSEKASLLLLRSEDDKRLSFQKRVIP